MVEYVTFAANNLNMRPGTQELSTVEAWSANLLAAGECSIEAQQQGNGLYMGAPFTFQNFYVHP